jgi:hypothetical protein
MLIRPTSISEVQPRFQNLRIETMMDDSDVSTRESARCSSAPWENDLGDVGE